MEPDPLSQGYPFELGDIWRQSVFGPKQDEESRLRPLITNFPALCLDDLSAFNKHDLEIPDINYVNGADDPKAGVAEHDLADHLLELTPQATEAFESTDVWSLDLELSDRHAVPRLYTWEAFENKGVPNGDHTAFLSEAGPQAFDSSLSQLQDSLAEPSTGVLGQDTMLRALCNLVLGRSSIFFQWDASKSIFSQTLEDVPVSGLSMSCVTSFVQKLVSFGSIYRALKDFSSAKVSSKHCAALVALKNCIAGTIDSVEEHITLHLPRTRSLLQLQALVDPSHQWLSILSTLKIYTSGCASDEQVISILSDQVHEIVSSENRFAAPLREVLAIVSGPWLEKLCTDIGLGDDRRRLYSVEADAEDIEDAIDESVSFGGSTSKSRPVPSFIHSDDWNLVQSTKASWALLRRHIPGYSLLAEDSDGAFTHDSEPDLSLSRGSASLGVSHDEYGNDRSWASDDVQAKSLYQLNDQMSLLPAPSLRHADKLQLRVVTAIQTTDEASTGKEDMLSEDLAFNPLEKLRLPMQAHNRNVNKALIRYLFRNCRLRQHVDVLRQHYFLGNGDFVSRLTTALFSAETQTAERKRGIIPTGEVVGLRLDAQAGQRWPPASSELRLSLMGVLTETYRSESYGQEKAAAGKELPGGLSFSIRELPEDEIERVLDIDSIYALDFLRLQYIPTPPLDIVVNPSALQGYDNGFRYLLRLLRAQHFTTRLSAGIAVRTRGQQDRKDVNFVARRQFATEAQHCISVLMSHAMEVCISNPWQVFAASLAAIEMESESEDGLNDRFTNMDGLRRIHDTCLQSIRSLLFLRRKQEKLRIAVEDVLTTTLRCASSFASDDGTGSGTDFSSFRQSVANLLQVLRTAISKPRKSNLITEATEDEVEAMKILLVRLSWNEFYTVEHGSFPP